VTRLPPRRGAFGETFFWKRAGEPRGDALSDRRAIREIDPRSGASRRFREWNSWRRRNSFEGIRGYTRDDAKDDLPSASARIARGIYGRLYGERWRRCVWIYAAALYPTLKVPRVESSRHPDKKTESAVEEVDLGNSYVPMISLSLPALAIRESNDWTLITETAELDSKARLGSFFFLIGHVHGRFNVLPDVS